MVSAKIAQIEMNPVFRRSDIRSAFKLRPALACWEAVDEGGVGGADRTRSTGVNVATAAMNWPTRTRSMPLPSTSRINAGESTAPAATPIGFPKDICTGDVDRHHECAS
jgi:hypothetical protein